MSHVRFIGCLHFGHEWMARHRGFNNSEEHDDHLINSYNSVVRKRDVVYILGDITMETSEFYYKLDLLNGQKHIVLGNHDKGKDISELMEYVQSIQGMKKYKGFWLTHCPIHPQELSFVKGNIHAHIHEMDLPYTEVEVNYWDKKDIIKSSSNNKYFNVDAKMIDYKPKTLAEIKEVLGITD